MMEEPMGNIESFENFKVRLIEIFEREGLSENLLSEIDRWHERKQKETDLPGGTIEQRVLFQVELAQIYFGTGRIDQAFVCLGDAYDQALDAGLGEFVTLIKILGLTLNIEWKNRI